MYKPLQKSDLSSPELTPRTPSDASVSLNAAPFVDELRNEQMQSLSRHDSTALSPITSLPAEITTDPPKLPTHSVPALKATITARPLVRLS